MDTYFNQQNNLGIMADHHPYPHLKQQQRQEEDDDLYSISSSSSSDSLEDDATSSPSLSSLSSSSSSSDHINSTGEGGGGGGPLYEMTSLMQQLPFKRGLSKHYQGKSQSFTSLSNVRCLEDLAKPEYHHPCNKKLKSCKSYAGGLSETDNNKKSPRSKKNSPSARGSWSSLAAAKRSNSFLGNKPPIPPQRTSSLFNPTQTPLFAS